MWFVSKRELSKYKALDKQMKAIDCLISKLIVKSGDVEKQKECWWQEIRDKYKIETNTINLDIDKGLITKVEEARNV